MGKKRQRGGWRKTNPEPGTIGPLLRKAGFIASQDDPVRVSASFDRDGRPRRIHARYADGWTCLLNLSLDGSFTLSQSLRMRISGRKVVAADVSAAREAACRAYAATSCDRIPALLKAAQDNTDQLISLIDWTKAQADVSVGNSPVVEAKP